ncbi:MAG: phenylalanine--tRNA ligase subunit alpha [Deltaproteobacteria bacterium]|nr:phenylalanine--tRNA ligase subunit alpha [Deltaproteobacteria bacterium]MBK8237675.1 phenylalanine--tRNA ligase subunit alpha [Deltaproteobacteria bacterium]MBK8719446.1 phenylalanine--tRNA ligase subunit alpha [Deltaproteobacteria bacterium]MBP7290657.1 phenylalanine--tRNA ligase subunit alpha [Nannocystaceae bacterium]
MREAFARDELPASTTLEQAYAVKVKYLGKKGLVTELSRQLGAMPPEQRREHGQRVNALKAELEALYDAHCRGLAEAAEQAALAQFEDLTAVAVPEVGSLHPITRTRRVLERVFAELGFDVADGPHVELARFNFDDLNIGADHPARDMADTFFVTPPPGSSLRAEDLVLRTHTSPVQVRTMLARKPPIRIVALGTVFRRDDDATHSPMFHQIEGLCVDTGTSFADLRATLYRFVSALFERELQVRFRPSFFPFVEPGAEFDMQCPFCGGRGCSVCKGSGWIELGGAGMVHPAVFEACGIDAERYTGWAFGFGIDRMAMLMHQIPDLRLMFEGDVRFLEQYPC